MSVDHGVSRSSTELLHAATSAGFDVITDPQLEVDPVALRLLSTESTFGYALAGDVLAVVSSELPTPAELHALEKQSGMLVTLAVAPRHVFDQIRDRATTITASGTDAVLSIGPALEEAVALEASDVHLTVGSVPVVRVGGELTPLKRFPVLSSADMDAAARWIAGDSLEAFKGDHDCAIAYAGARWRVALYHQGKALTLALRRITSEVPRLETLGLSQGVKALANLSQGLVLFCGPTGSGKSTSLAALIDRINRTRACHILTIEDPIEYVHPSHRAIVHQREVGDDTESFSVALRHALRQDPDVILVGEMRDLETMRTALSAAETGHLVFGTIHASSAAGAFTRLIDSFPAAQQDQVRTQLASSLRAVVAQLLLPAAEPGKRALASEVLLVNSAVRNIVRENRLVEITTVLDSSVGEGMVSMDRSLAQLVSAGKITEETAELWVTDAKAYAAHAERLPKPNLTAFNEFEDY